MITLGPIRVAGFAILAVVLPATVAVAAEPTLSDIAGCNQQAAQKTGASALPAPPGAPGRDLARARRRRRRVAEAAVRRPIRPDR
jgi:hypothetical protein